MAKFLIGCCDLKSKSFYITNNILDILIISLSLFSQYIVSNILETKFFNIKMIIDLLILFFLLVCLIYYFNKKNYNTSFHKIYVFIRLVFIIINIYSCFKLIFIYFGMFNFNLSKDQSGIIMVNVFGGVFIMIYVVWNIYLTYNLYQIIINKKLNEAKNSSLV